MRSKLLLGGLAAGIGAFLVIACVGDDPVTGNPPTSDGGTGDTSTASDAPSNADSGDGGDATPSAIPVIDIASGDSFACAVREDGSVVCWGDNELGETGQPLAGGETCDGKSCRLPTVVAGVSDAKAIAAGPHQACAVTKTGKVLCWGANDYGVLGHATTNDVPCGMPENRICTFSPVEVPTVTDAVGVALGRISGCSWNAAGAVTCWGNNAVGGLARGTQSDTILPPGKSTAFDTTGATAIAVDQWITGHTCAIRTDGTAACWGRNSASEVGIPGSASPYCPHSIGGSGEACEKSPLTVKNASDAGIGTVTSIATTDGTTCMSSANDVYCWGNTGHGVGDDPSKSTLLNPTLRPALAGLSKLAGTFSHSCGIASGNQVKCWGENQARQLGVDLSVTNNTACAGSTPCSSAPVTVAGVTAKKVTASRLMTVALTLDGNVLAWGSNQRAQLGHLPTTGEAKCTAPCTELPQNVTMP